jgi:hypothetical protein
VKSWNLGTETWQSPSLIFVNTWKMKANDPL